MPENQTDTKRIRLILICIFVVLAVVLFFLLNNIRTYSQKQHLHLITERYELAYQTVYAQRKLLSESLYSGIMGRFAIEDFYRKLITADETQKNILRKELLAKVMPRYKVLKKTVKLRQLHFHLSNSESFLRLHRPELFGDNLTGIRKTVEYVNQEHVAIDSFEEGKTNNGYRFVFPIIAKDGTHLGSVELSYGAEAFTSAMMHQYSVLSNFFMKETIVKSSIPPEEISKTYRTSHHPGYYFDKNVLAELEKTSQEKMKICLAPKSITDRLFANAHSSQAMSIYDSSMDNVFTSIPVMNSLTQELNAFFTVRSQSPIFRTIEQQFRVVFSLSLLLLALLLFTFCQRYSKRRVLENTMALLQEERDMFMQGPVMTFTWQNSKDWPVTQVSKNVQAILGYHAEEFLDGSILYASLIHPDDLEKVLDEVVAHSGVGGSGFTHDPYRLQSCNGEWVWILDASTLVRNRDGEISHYTGYLVDITSSMLMKEEVIETKNRLELVIEGAQLGTWDWNIKTGELLLNERWAEMLGYNVNEIEPHNSSWKRLIHLEDADELSHILTDYLEGRIPLYAVEHRLRHRDGHWVWVLAVGKVFEWDGKGDPLRVVGIHLDISESKQAALQLLDAKEAAESANRAKSAFLSNMSHELRTPLNAILGYTQIFNGDSSLTSQQQGGIKTIHQSGEHLLMLINDILDLSKIEARKMELIKTEFCLVEFLLGVTEIVRERAAKKGINFLYEAEGSLPVVIKADELRLRQILLNLLSNAVKFTEHGECTLRVQSQVLDEKKALLSIVVEDSGVGIDPDMLEKIFEPFQQTGERLQYSEGSGLGLAISRKLVRLMGGELQVLSPINEDLKKSKGPGSCFSFSIEVILVGDAVVNDPQYRRVTGYTIPGEEGGHRKILIVDDEESNRMVLRDTLKPLGFITSEAEDGSEVLAFCKEFHPDVILMDLHMPQMDGFTATEHLKLNPEFGHIPVLAITASTEEKNTLRERCLANGFSGLITKPYFIEELLQVIAEQLHVELQYAGESTGKSDKEELSFEIPPNKYLEKLNSVIRLGDINGVIEQAEKIASLKSGRYKSFSGRIVNMADDLQISALEEYVLGILKSR